MASLTLTLMATTSAQAQSLHEFTTAPPPPPLSNSSPYSGQYRGQYILPGTRTRSRTGNTTTAETTAKNKSKLPALPRNEIRAPLSLTSDLPSPRRLIDPHINESINPPNHRASTPATLRYATPQHRQRPYYPKPNFPSVADAQPLPSATYHETPKMITPRSVTSSAMTEPQAVASPPVVVIAPEPEWIAPPQMMHPSVARPRQEDIAPASVSESQSIAQAPAIVSMPPAEVQRKTPRNNPLATTSSAPLDNAVQHQVVKLTPPPMKAVEPEAMAEMPPENIITLAPDDTFPWRNDMQYLDVAAAEPEAIILTPPPMKTVEPESYAAVEDTLPALPSSTRPVVTPALPPEELPWKNAPPFNTPSLPAPSTERSEVVILKEPDFTDDANIDVVIEDYGSTVPPHTASAPERVVVIKNNESNTEIHSPLATPEDLAIVQAATVDSVTVSDPPRLSQQSRDIIAKTPSGIDTKLVTRTPKPVIIKRTDPAAGNIPQIDVRSHEEMGMKIEIRKADVNVYSYLEQGYENLIAGHEAIAAGYYKEALRAEPENQMALFGLATTYQRMGQIEESRDLYGQLLKANPTHREALNNFMALISNESPQEAIEELEQLETENPDFSPIPAQLGIVYNKIGDHNMAVKKLVRAIELSPDNTSYKYNLAVTLDSMGKSSEAADMYVELIEDYRNGATLPEDIVTIRNRAIFLSNKK